MSDIAINPVTRRVQFTGNTGTGPYAFTFNVLQSSDIVVYKNNVLLTETTDYTVSIATNGTGNITMVVALVLTDILTIIGGRELSRTTDFVTAGDLLASSLNEQLDSNVIMSQQLDERFGRTLAVPPGDEDKTLDLPLAADRADKIILFDESGNVTAAAPSDFFGNAVLGGNFIVNTATGDGSQTAFGLTVAPGIKTNIQIHIDGVYQNKATFSLSGSTVTFTEAPPLNAAIEFMMGESVTTITGDASAITYNQGGTGAQDRTVRGKLQETVSVKDFGAVGDGVTDDTAAIQAMIDYLDGIGVDQYFIEGTIKVTSQIDLKGGQLVGSGSMSSAGSAKIITATSLTRADGAVFSNGRGARYITFEPATAYAEDLFYTEFLTTLTECRFTNYNSVLCKANNDADFVCVYVDKCHFVNVRHAILTDGQDGGASSDNNIIQFTNNYCFGLSGTQDISSNPDKYHGFQDGNIGDSSANAFIHLGVMRAGAVTGNTFERLHYILHAEGFSDTLLGNNYFEAVDITYTWDYADNSTFNRPIGLGDTAQTNDVLYHTFREHHQPDAIGFRGQRVFRLETVSGTFTDGETITTSGGDSAIVVQHETNSNVMDVRQISGTFSDGEVITGGTSTETATIESSRELKYAKYGHIVDMSGRFGVNILRSNNILGHDEPVVIGSGSNTAAATSYDVVPTDNNWVNAVFENQTNDAERSAIILNTHDSSGGYTNLWYAFEVTRDTAWTEAELKIFRRDAASVDELFKIDRSGHWLPATDVTYNLGGTSNQWAKTYTGQLNIKDGITAPSTESGHAVIYVDSADGDLKVKFGDGTVKTISTDT